MPSRRLQHSCDSNVMPSVNCTTSRAQLHKPEQAGQIAPALQPFPYQGCAALQSHYCILFGDKAMAAICRYADFASALKGGIGAEVLA